MVWVRERTNVLNFIIKNIVALDGFQYIYMGHAVAYWLRHYTTNRKVAGSIPDEVNF
jgi:hypothetical protein